MQNKQYKDKKREMKKIIAAIIFSVTALSAYGQALSLDESIKEAVQRVQNGLDEKAKIIVYQFQSHNAGLSNYVLNELFDGLVNSQKFTVLDRTAQEVVNAELEFQFSASAGMISDESLANLTSRIGAQAIVTGSLDDIGDEYRFRIRVIGTETMAAVVSYTTTVPKNDRRITAFRGPRTKTAGEKIGTGALNMLLGLGSYLERDISGGLTITAVYALSAGLFVVEAAALDWDSPAVGVPATIGVTAAALNIIYGFARPFIYNRSPKTALVMDNTRLGIVPVSDNKLAFQLTHIIKF